MHFRAKSLTASVDTPDPQPAVRATPLYSRLSKRLKAALIDPIIILSLLVAALFVTGSIGSDHVGRVLGVTFVAILLLYQPLAVSLTGNSVGHYRTKLRVVDNRTDGNISFMKAVVRAVIKDVLGVWSFVTMATASRHQSVHDLLTDSRVQVRDLIQGRRGPDPRRKLVPEVRRRPGVWPPTRLRWF